MPPALNKCNGHSMGQKQHTLDFHCADFKCLLIVWIMFLYSFKDKYPSRSNGILNSSKIGADVNSDDLFECNITREVMLCELESDFCENAWTLSI